MFKKIFFTLLAVFFLSGNTKAAFITNVDDGSFEFRLDITHWGSHVNYAKLDLFIQDFPRLNEAMIFDDISITHIGQKFVLTQADENFSEAKTFLTNGLPEWIIVSLTTPTRTAFVEATEPDALFGDSSGDSGIDLIGSSIQSIELQVGDLVFIYGSDPNKGPYTQIAVQGLVTVNATIAKEFDLTVAKSGTGKGTVTSSPPGIDCGDVCTMCCGVGTTVTLTAVPDEESIFSGWAGCDTFYEKTCTVEMTRDKEVTAKFGFHTETMPWIPLLLLDD